MATMRKEIWIDAAADDVWAVVESLKQLMEAG